MVSTGAAQMATFTQKATTVKLLAQVTTLAHFKVFFREIADPVQAGPTKTVIGAGGGLA